MADGGAKESFVPSKKKGPNEGEIEKGKKGNLNFGSLEMEKRSDGEKKKLLLD